MKRFKANTKYQKEAHLGLNLWGHSKSTFPQFHQFLDPLPLLRFRKFPRYPLPLRVRTFDLSNPLRTLIDCLSQYVQSCDHGGIMLKGQFHLFRMLCKYLLSTLVEEPPLPLYVFVRFLGYPLPPSDRTFFLNGPLGKEELTNKLR